MKLRGCVRPASCALALAGWVALAPVAPVNAQVPSPDSLAGHSAAHGAGAAFAGAGTATHRHPLSHAMEGVHRAVGPWTIMLHGVATLGVRRDPEPRGTSELFHTGMVMASARRALGPGWLELQAMASAEPLMGPAGYPLLLQTGETADGIATLVDRQHPHDALMALSASFRAPIEEGVWAFAYLAPVGSPALGPPPFMHRASAGGNPAAPIAHHVLDATHISHGVVTAGVFSDRVQFEASVFNGREPDQRRWRPDALALNSFAGRVTLTPGTHWAIQASFGDLGEPEQLHPAVDVHRATVSVTHERAFGPFATATTVAWGRNVRQETTMSLGEARVRLPGPLFDHFVSTSPLPPGADDSLLLLFPRRVQAAALVESALRWRGTTGFVRWERTRKDELYAAPDLRHSTFYDVSKIDLGISQDVSLGALRIGLGGTIALHGVPDDLVEAYGSSPASYTLFGRLALGGAR
jgi:hypothetical protein